MKKIVTVSLVAMMAVSAAHADLASTAYVEGKVGEHAAVKADANTLGHVKIGTGIDVDANGVISVSAGGMIGEKEITTGMIADSAITTAKIANDAVTSDKIADLNVTNGKLAYNAVTSDKILDGEVKTDDIADLAVTNAKLAADAVTSGKILDGTIAIADLNSEVTDMMNGHQLKSNIVTDIDDGAKLQEAEKLEKYTSVSYVDTKVATATQNLPTLGQDVKDLKNEVVEMKKTDTALEDAIGVNADDIGLAKDQTGAVTSFTNTTYLTGATTLTGAAVALDATIKGLSDNKQDELSATNVTSTGDGVVKTVVGADGKLTVTKEQVVGTDVADNAIATAKIADMNVTKAKLSDDVQTSLGLADGSLQKSTLEDASIRKAENEGDGQYALTMKVVDGVISYQWDKISY